MGKIDRAALRRRIQTLEGLTDEERAALLELAATKRYGLVWEEREEAVEERLREELPVLIEDKELALTDGGEEAPNHILIEGDNLEALTTLSYTHEGKVDVIYIDPPYNTGNKDFVYNDSFVDSEDSYRHSKWLSFMSKRLRIAKRLLSDRGVIFISIDDNEQANLKLLCDEVFGEQCFMGNVSWQRTYSPRNDKKGIVREAEYLCVYSRNPDWQPTKLPRTESMDAKYKNPDNDVAPWTSDNPCAPGAVTHQGMVYAMQHPFTGELIYPATSTCWRYQQDEMLRIMQGWVPYELLDIDDADRRAEVCGIAPQDVRQGVKAIMLSVPLEEARLSAEAVLKRGQWPKFYFTKNGRGGIRRKTYLENVEGRLVTNLWPHSEVGHTDEAKKQLMSLFDGKAPFDTPKPVRLLERILQVAGTTTSTILDFFAGSGTTLHAVMQLNKEDGGKRQCILVTNNENNICREVTYERNRRVIEGYTTPKGVQVEGLRENNLRYYRTHLLPRERTNRNMRRLVAASTDLLCIKEGIYSLTPWCAVGSADNPSPIGEGSRMLTQNDVRLFSDGNRAMMVIYNEEVIPDIVDWLQSASATNALTHLHNNAIKVYVFSPGAYAWDDDFAPVIDKVELCALPEAIYQAYKSVLPKKRVRRETAEESPNGADRNE